MLTHECDDLGERLCAAVHVRAAPSSRTQPTIHRRLIRVAKRRRKCELHDPSPVHQRSGLPVVAHSEQFADEPVTVTSPVLRIPVQRFSLRRYASAG